MATREAPMQSLYFDVLAYGSHTTTQTSETLDILGYASLPALSTAKGAEAASFLWNVGVWTSGIWTPTLNESDNDTGPWTPVDPMYVKYYLDGYVHPTIPTVASATDENKMYSISYVGGLKRYIQLVVSPAAAASCIFGVLGILEALRETQDTIYNRNRVQDAQDFPDIDWPPR
jgi:hypothetical protein